MYEGNAPCPGCGRTGEQVARKSKDSLCYDCQNQLEIGRAICKERDLARDYYRMDDLQTGILTWYTIPIHEVDTALRNLLQTFSQFDSRHVSSKGRYDESTLAGRIEATTARDHFILPCVTFNAVKALCNTLKDVCYQLKKERDNYQQELGKQLAEQKNAIYNEGVAYGRNLLTQLNRGEISVNDFEKPVRKY